MDGMIFISSSGAGQMLQAQAVHANNLANVNTTGFRADRIQFVSVPTVIDENTLDSKTYAYSVEPRPSFEQGATVPTQRDLDIAIQGDGWIAVTARDGSESYTRNGNLNVSVDGILTTGHDYPVLGSGGEISIPPYHKVDIGSDGTISIIPLVGNNNQPVILDRIKLVKPEHSDLYKTKDGLFKVKGNEADADADVRVVTGYLEGSNVNPVESLTNMISIARQYEMQMKMINFAHENDQSLQQILTIA
ncbi:MAG: flagellar basal body rod protein FlgF [Candidatus Berkiella sp.]